MDIDKLAGKQVEIADAIHKALINAKKDSKERKTRDWVKKRREELAAQWQVFTRQHSMILELDCQTHKYVTQSFYSQTHTLIMDYEAYLNGIEASLGQFSKDSGGDQIHTVVVTQKLLVRKQISKISKLTKLIEDTKVEMTSEHPTTYWEYKKNTINQQWVAVQELQENIELEDDNSTDDIYGIVENKVLDIIVNLCGKMSEESTSPDNKLQLPRIEVPHFDGSYENWGSFHDLFIRFVHTNKKLGNVEKMQLLKTRVTGEASKLLQHLTITEVNYETAWELLQKRFDNKRMILFSHINNIFSVSKMTMSTALDLKRIHDTVIESLRAINNLAVNTDTWGPLIIHILQEKVDKETLQLYEQSVQRPKEIPSLEEFLTFIETRFNSLELINQSKSDAENSKARSSRLSHYANPTKCLYCKENHSLYACKRFGDQTVTERFNFVKKEKICRNCLCHHNNSTCLSKKTCSKCKMPHHTLLHFERRREDRPIQTNTVTNLFSGMDSRMEVLLTTALIKIKNFQGGWEYFRALIDPGSQSSFITEEAAEALGKPRTRACMTISGVGGAQSAVSTRGKIVVEMKPRMPSEFHLRCELLILNKLTSAIPTEDTEDVISIHDTNLVLADPTYNVSGPIDVLIGSDIVPTIMKRGVKKQHGWLAQDTEFGWIMSGPTKLNDEASKKNIRSMVVISEEPQLTRFWEIEEVQADTQSTTTDDQQCEEFYQKTTIRNEDSSYTVRIPFKESTDCLGASQKTATARLLQMERKFAGNPKFEENYKNFMKEYEDMGHMVPAKDKKPAVYYMPHHAVCKEDSTTTKLRVVFDASAKTSTGKCLNELMFTGPRLQEDLSQILLRWRKHKIALTADIEKMYRQIKIHENDQLYQTILWRYNTYDPIKEYRLATVTYGTSSAPYLAVKTLQQLATDELENYPLAAQVTMHDYYVDDLLTGADSIQGARKLQQEMITLLSKGGFNLRKWSSNCSKLISVLPAELQDKDFLEFGEDDTKKMLGVHWAPRSDQFKYRVKIEVDENPTKRKILSQIARLYDPLGWLAPVIIKAKLLIQELWVNENKWDEAVPDEIKTKWIKFQTQLPRVEDLKIPRWISHSENDVSIELHGFCDASEKAYGAVIYTRTTSRDGVVNITLLIAKSKVAPCKMKKTLPRLELCGAVLLAKLLQQSMTSSYQTSRFTQFCTEPCDYNSR